MWYCETTGGKDEGEKAGELIRVKRTEIASRGRVRDLGHILASRRIVDSRSGGIIRVM